MPVVILEHVIYQWLLDQPDTEEWYTSRQIATAISDHKFSAIRVALKRMVLMGDILLSNDNGQSVYSMNWSDD